MAHRVALLLVAAAPLVVARQLKLGSVGPSPAAPLFVAAPPAALYSSASTVPSARRTDGRLDLVALDAAEAQERGALCLDGSTPGLYYEPADTSADATSATKWVLAFKGGGWCWDEDDCASRARSVLGSAKQLTQPNDMSVFGSGLAYTGRNGQFKSYHHVVLWYCDGGVFAGDREEPVQWPDPWDKSKNMTLYFRGRRVLDFMMDSLKQPPFGLSSATEVLLTGGSSGGYSAYLHADKVAAHMPAFVKRFGVAPINGWFAHVPGFFQLATRNFMEEFAHFSEMQNLVGSGAPGCYEALPKEEHFKCVFTDYSYAYSKAPIFPMQALDVFIASQNETSSAFALANVQCMMQHLKVAACEPGVVSRLNGVMSGVVAAITRAKKSQGPSAGGFLTSCGGHTLYESPMFYTTASDGVPMINALSQWWNLLGGRDLVADGQTQTHWHLPCQLNKEPPFQCEAGC